VDAAQVALELAPGARGEDLRVLAAGAPRRRARRSLGDERGERRVARRRRRLGGGETPVPGERELVQAARHERSAREQARRAHDIERRVVRVAARGRPRRREAPPRAGAQHLVRRPRKRNEASPSTRVTRWPLVRGARPARAASRGASLGASRGGLAKAHPHGARADAEGRRVGANRTGHNSSGVFVWTRRFLPTQRSFWKTLVCWWLS